MTTIQQFREIRRDGKVIDESMKAEDIFALGSTEKVIEVQWHNGSQPVSIRNVYGVLAKVVPGREFVATNEHDESGQHRMLSIINADGSRRLQLPNIQKIRANDEAGEFCWFEPPRIESPNVFGVVFSCSSDNSMFQLDIDAINGAVVGVYPMR
ncbi:MAG: hypothetical protein ACYC3O_11795 [Burkholderiales bacterium]